MDKSDFVKIMMELAEDFDIFYRYVSSEYDLLKTTAWLKKHQNDDSVSDDLYVKNILKCLGDYAFYDPALYDDYISLCVNKLDERYFEYVHTNVYAPNFDEKLQNILSSQNGILNEEEQNYYHRIIFVVGKKDNDIFFSPIHLYTLKELDTMIKDGQITPLYSIFEDEGFTQLQVLEKIKNENALLRENSMIAGSNIIDSYLSETTTEGKNRWMTRNAPFVKYIRRYALNFTKYAETFNTKKNTLLTTIRLVNDFASTGPQSNIYENFARMTISKIKALDYDANKNKNEK